MLNPIPAGTVLGLNNPLVEQTAHTQAPQEIKTNDGEQLEQRPVQEMQEQSANRPVRGNLSEEQEVAPPPEAPPPPGMPLAPPPENGTVSRNRGQPAVGTLSPPSAPPP
ncbi:MAG: hypothetical protein HQL52_09075, partial [Magnetococcales bacterium]|nr:hypothetical protein [Magnetococcales bacterium]